MKRWLWKQTKSLCFLCLSVTCKVWRESRENEWAVRLFAPNFIMMLLDSCVLFQIEIYVNSWRKALVGPWAWGGRKRWVPAPYGASRLEVNVLEELPRSILHLNLVGCWSRGGSWLSVCVCLCVQAWCLHLIRSLLRAPPKTWLKTGPLAFLLAVCAT